MITVMTVDFRFWAARPEPCGGAPRGRPLPWPTELGATWVRPARPAQSSECKIRSAQPTTELEASHPFPFAGHFWMLAAHANSQLTVSMQRRLRRRLRQCQRLEIPILPCPFRALPPPLVRCGRETVGDGHPPLGCLLARLRNRLKFAFAIRTTRRHSPVYTRLASACRSALRHQKDCDRRFPILGAFCLGALSRARGFAPAPLSGFAPRPLLSRNSGAGTPRRSVDQGSSAENSPLGRRNTNLGGKALMTCFYYF